MKNIMIIGGGEVGSFLAERFIAEGMAVTVMDENPELISDLSGRLDAACVQGNGTNLADLSHAGAAQAEVFIAATNLDEANLISCLSAKQLGIPLIIAVTRKLDSRRLERTFSFRKLGIHLLINMAEAVRDELLGVVEATGINEQAEFCGGRLFLVGHLVEGKSAFVSRRVGEINRGVEGHSIGVVALVRQGALSHPGEDERVEEGDYLYLMVPHTALMFLHETLQDDGGKKRVAVINGGGPLCLLLAKALVERHYQVTVLVDGEEEAVYLRAKLEAVAHARVEVGDGMEIRTLRRIKVAAASLFISITTDDQVNLAACMAARHLGAGKTMATIKANDMLDLSPLAGLEVAVAPRMAAAKLVQKAVHEQLLNYRAVARMNMEVVELMAQPGSRASRRPLSQLKMPEGAILGGVVSAHQVLLPGADYTMAAGDRAVVLTPPEMLMEVEELFAARKNRRNKELSA